MDNRSTEVSLVLVVAMLAQKCNAQGPWCQAVVVSLPPPALLTWAYEWTPAGCISSSCPTWRLASFDPPTPPPRASV
jgi:hypothetical protein